jgi:hypothetical protein
MWSSPKDHKLCGWISKSKPVVCVVQNPTGTQISTDSDIVHFVRRIPTPVAYPFQSAAKQGERNDSVLAYEIEWENVVGFDFCKELCSDGRLALETKRLHKFTFPSLLDAYR